MPALLCGIFWLGFVVYLLSRILRQFRAHRLAALPPNSGAEQRAAVSIIVPVRNEVDNIAICLSGLAAQKGLAPGSSITIVDDGSEDRTTAIVRQWTGHGRPIELIMAGTLPDGWIGKPHACWTGASAAAGAWFCFIDADVHTDARLVAAAIDAAEAQHIDMLTLHPLQELGSFWERVVMPAGLLLIACAKPLNGDGGQTSPASDANGQFILIRRQVYFAVGGHAAVAREICEDRALAANVVHAGFHFRALAAEHLARTRMYRDRHSLWEGLAKNSIEILGSASMTVGVSIVGVLVGWAVPLLPTILATATMTTPASAPELIGLGLAATGSVVVLGVQLRTATHLRIPVAYGLLMPIGYTAAALIVCDSLLSRLRGRVSWKGRSYDFRRRPSPGRF